MLTEPARGRMFERSRRSRRRARRRETCWDASAGRSTPSSAIGEVDAGDMTWGLRMKACRSRAAVRRRVIALGAGCSSSSSRWRRSVAVAVPAAAGAVVDHLRLQGEPAARPQRIDDVGLVRGRLRLAAAARAATRRCSSRRRARTASARSASRNATRRTARSSAWRAWCSPCRRRARVYTLLGGVPGDLRLAAASRSRSSAPPRPTSSINTLTIATAIALSTRQSILKVWNENFLWSAPSYFVGAGVGRCCRPGWCSTRRALAGGARDGAALPDLPHLQGLSRPHRRRAAARPRDGGPAPRDDRSAGAGHRREGSDLAVAHPPRAALRDRGRARARHVRERHPGREDGGAAARHRQARGARAHPLEARAR